MGYVELRNGGNDDDGGGRGKGERMGCLLESRIEIIWYHH